MSTTEESDIETAVSIDTKWQEQAIIHLGKASDAAAKGHAGTWDREMQLARLCMEHEQKLTAIKTP